MPKIRLSALATDMKGKSGGSVFSNNAGGVYFRNNPSGTGSKKPATSIRKQKFATLAQSWRSLTDAQQQAWSDAGILYPTTNAWGEPRIPKGFELFMRLNSNLLALNLPTLVTPLAPRSLPIVNNLSYNTLDLFQLLPQSWFNCEDISTPTNFYQPTIPLYSTSDMMAVDRVIGARFSLQSINGRQPFLTDNFTAFQCLQSPAKGWFLSIKDLKESQSNVVLQIILNAGTLVFVAGVNPIEFQKDFHLAVQFVNGNLSATKVFLNGALLPTILTSTGVIADLNITAPLILNAGAMLPSFPLQISDFRQYNDLLTAAQINQVYLGYILGTEFQLIPMNKLALGKFVNYTTAGDAEPMTIGDPPNLADVIVPKTTNLAPYVLISYSDNFVSGFLLRITVTPFVSFGKAVVSNVFRTVTADSWLNKTSSDISTPLQKLLIATIGESSLMYKVQVIDQTTGAVGVPIDVPPVSGKPRRRFKAGAELSGKVN